MLKNNKGKQMNTTQKLLFLAAYISILVAVFRS